MVRLLDHSFSKLEPKKLKNIVVFIGYTGTGKSTFFKYDDGGQEVRGFGIERITLFHEIWLSSFVLALDYRNAKY